MTRSSSLRLLTAALALLASCAPPSASAVPTASASAIATASPPASGYQMARPSVDGTGRIYLGREIASFMSHQGAPWLERAEREAEERPTLVLENLGLRPTDVVADVGAGSGYFSLRMARQVPRGKVYAVDIQPEMLRLVEKAAAQQRAANVETVLGTEVDPRLPEGSVDLALLVDAYHELSHPREMMLNLGRALKPGGRVVLVEYRAEDPDVPIKPLHKMTEAQARLEMEAAGFRFVKNVTVLPWQHLLIFESP